MPVPTHQQTDKAGKNNDPAPNKPQAYPQLLPKQIPAFPDSLLNLTAENRQAIPTKRVLQLQSLVGNRAVSRLIAAAHKQNRPVLMPLGSTAVVQPKTVTKLPQRLSGLVVQRVIEQQENKRRLGRFILDKNKVFKLGLERPKIEMILNAIILEYNDDQIDLAEQALEQRLYGISLTQTESTQAEYRSVKDLFEMSLSQLDQYTQVQADWYKHPTLNGLEGEVVQRRSLFRNLLAFAREGQGEILTACGNIKVITFFHGGCFTFSEETATLVHDKARCLRAYSKAASASGIPLKLTPTDDLNLALKWGEDLGILLNGIPMAAECMRYMNESIFHELVKHQLIADLVQYYQLFKPIFHAPNGADIKAYVQLRIDDNVDPIKFKDVPYLRNPHRFHGEVLQKLKLNWSEGNKAQKPLTLVLHSALDHEGTLCRHPGLKEIFEHTDIFVLMLEGVKTLDEVGGQVGGIAQKFGKEGKIDQVLFMGHGEGRSIELAGDQGEQAEVVSQALNLDRAAQQTNQLFDQLLKLMGGDEQPRRRILFNACLTNSNEVPITAPLDKGNFELAKQQVQEYIKTHASLATHLQNMAREKKVNVTVVGANASIKKLRLIHPQTGQLDLISNEDLVIKYYNLVSANRSLEEAQSWAKSVTDPSVTAPKIEYVKLGKEPKGALRAVFESYWHDGKEKDTLEAMKWRVQNCQTNSWSDVVICSFYHYLLNNKVGLHHILLRSCISMATTIDKIRQKQNCKVSFFDKYWFGNIGATIINHLFPQLLATQDWAQFHHAPLVVYQVWLKHDPAKANNLIQHLGQHFICKTAQEFIDFEYLSGQGLLPALLQGQNKGNFLVALLGLQEQDQGQKPLCTNFLNPFTDPPDSGNVFHPDQQLLFQELLKGYAREKTILENMGRSFEVTAGVTKANVKIMGEGKNTIYVGSISKTGKVMAGTKVYLIPHQESKVVGNIQPGTEVFIVGQKSFGENNKWYAIEYTPVGSKEVETAFIKQADVEIKL